MEAGYIEQILMPGQVAAVRELVDMGHFHVILISSLRWRAMTSSKLPAKRPRIEALQTELLPWRGAQQRTSRKIDESNNKTDARLKSRESFD